MSLQQEVELLRNIPLFANIEPNRLKLLAFAAERLLFHAGDTLCRQGEEGDCAWIVVAGEAEVTVAGAAGEVAVATLGRNDFVGETAILCDVPRTATVRAKTELEALAISKDLFFQLLGQFPEMAVEIMRELALRVERTTRQLREALADGAPRGAPAQEPQGPREPQGCG